MNIPFEIKSAVENRRSIRSYKTDALEMETYNALVSFSKNPPLPFAHTTEIKFFKSDPTKELFYTFNSPEDNMAFISEIDPISLGKTGFLGELLVLKATSLGVGTCWVGSFKKSKLLELSPEALVDPINNPTMGQIDSGKRTVALSPIGYFEEKGLRLYDRLAHSVFKLNRKVIKDLLQNPEIESSIPSDMVSALEMGAKAPSAINMQPWRFSFDQEFSYVDIGLPSDFKPFKWAYPNIDIGICACHIYYTFVSLGYEPKVEVFQKNDCVVFRIRPGKKPTIRPFIRKLTKRAKTIRTAGKTVATSHENKLGYNDLRGALRTVIALYPKANPAAFGIQVALRTAAALCTKIDPSNKGMLGVVRTAAKVYSKLDTKQRGFNKLICTAKTLLPVLGVKQHLQNE